MKLSEIFSTVESLSRSSISLEVLDPELRNCQALILPQDQYLHHCEECRRFKLSDKAEVCIVNKSRSMEIARRWKRPFCGFCPNHIWDLAVPVCFRESLVAILYLGGLHEAPDAEKKQELLRYGEFIRQYILLELVHSMKYQDSRKKREINFYLAHTMQFIEENYSTAVSLADLARLLKVDPEHLGRQITALAGKTFRQLLTARRLKQAEILVRLHHGMSFAQIAAYCGFSDSNYFSVVFKKFFGRSPRDYRRQGLKPTEQ